MLDKIESVVFYVIGPLLWGSGIWLFMHSDLSRRRKVIWVLVLVDLGALIGFVLPLNMIRNKFILILLLLPVLALVDLSLAKSNRGFFFWFRACAFEICTVFAAAGLVRFILNILAISPLI